MFLLDIKTPSLMNLVLTIVLQGIGTSAVLYQSSYMLSTYRVKQISCRRRELINNQDSNKDVRISND